VLDGMITCKMQGGNAVVSMEECLSWPVVAGDPVKAMYVRAELMGRGHATAWTQPFWIEG